MPVTPTYPGVYVEELPSGVHTIVGVSTSTTAFIGYAPSGPILEATSVENFTEYTAIFGGLSLDGELGHAVQQFFLNGGSQAVIVRVTSGSATASVSLALGGTTVLVVSAASAGDFGNLVRLDVDYKTRRPDSLFNLTVTRYERRGLVLNALVTENHVNLSMCSSSPAFVEDVVNSASKLVRVSRPLAASMPAFAPGTTGTAQSGLHTALPVLAPNQTNLYGVLDGVRPFTLNLGPFGTSGIPAADIAFALTNAITSAGITGLSAAASPGSTASGGYVLLSSTTTTEESSVEITSGPNDAARALKLGAQNGGREFDLAGEWRPQETGSTSADLQAYLDAGAVVPAASVTLTVTDETNPAAPVTVLSKTGAFSGGPIANLVTLVRSALAADPDLAGIGVELVGGSHLRALPSPAEPAGKPAAANLALSVKVGANELLPNQNVRQYWLGVGPQFGGQMGASPGADGSPSQLATDYAGAAIDALRKVDLFNLLSIPDTAAMTDSSARAVIAAAQAFCEERRAFLLVDPSPKARSVSEIETWVGALDSNKNSAVFFPRIAVADPLRGMRVREVPASGALAGVFARTDTERGVWKAPAGTSAVVRGVQALGAQLTDAENGQLNPLGINCLRSFPFIGSVVWGTRTLEGSDALASEWKYVPVRRTALFIEESLFRGTKWVVFEPNDEPLWGQIRVAVGSFMNSLFRQGAFQGKTPREAYLVKCDAETTTQDDIDRGIVNILVGFAPLKPAEFVILQIKQLAGQLSA
jgi:phage tail sheath protein FI